MARITVEDCLDKVANRFELVELAARRARLLERSNEDSLVAHNADKHTVVALKEIAEGKIDSATLDRLEKAEELENSGF